MARAYELVGVARGDKWTSPCLFPVLLPTGVVLAVVLCGTDWSLCCMVELLCEIGSQFLQGVQDGGAYAPVEDRRFRARSVAGPQQSNNPANVRTRLAQDYIIRLAAHFSQACLLWGHAVTGVEIIVPA